MKKQKAGFSIVELIVVIVVIAILVTIAVVSYSWMRNDAIDAKMDATVADVKKALRIKLTKTGSMSFSDAPRSRDDLLRAAYLSDLKDTINVHYKGVISETHDAKNKPMVDFTAIPGLVLIISHNASKKQFTIDYLKGDGHDQQYTVEYNQRFSILDNSHNLPHGYCYHEGMVEEAGWRGDQELNMYCVSGIKPRPAPRRP